MSATEWADDPRCVVRLEILQGRLSSGWGPEEALTTPEGEPKRAVFLTAFGETKRPAEWIKDPRCAITLASLYYRLKRGWPAEKALGGVTRKYISADGGSCPNGHELKDENLYVEPSGRRRCRACMRASDQHRVRRAS